MLNNISNFNQQYSTTSFQAKMRSKDIKAMKDFYDKSLRETTESCKVNYIIKGSQNFLKFLDKISEGDNRFILTHAKNNVKDVLVLTHSKDKKISELICSEFRSIYTNPITYYNEIFSEKMAKIILEAEKILSSRYEMKHKV